MLFACGQPTSDALFFKELLLTHLDPSRIIPIASTCRDILSPEGFLIAEECTFTEDGYINSSNVGHFSSITADRDIIFFTAFGDGTSLPNGNLSVRAGRNISISSIFYPLSGTPTNGTIFLNAGEKITAFPINIAPGDGTSKWKVCATAPDVSLRGDNVAVGYGPECQLPTLSISATQDIAVEGGAPGIVTITRTGDTTSSFELLLGTVSTAIEGYDYQMTPPLLLITMASGQTSATLQINALEDAQPEDDEPIEVMLQPHYLYSIGSPNKAVVTIKDNDDDADRDGFTVAAGDCNDTDPAIHPGATELCNEVDDNCNGEIDEGDACPCVPIRNSANVPVVTSGTVDIPAVCVAPLPSSIAIASPPFGSTQEFSDGSKLEVTCEGQPVDEFPWLIPAYKMWYTTPSGKRNRIAQCLFSGGANGASFRAKKDTDGDGLPDCLISTTWENIDGGENDQPRCVDGEGLFCPGGWVFTTEEEPFLDVLKYDYNANTGKLSWKNEKYEYPPGTESIPRDKVFGYVNSRAPVPNKGWSVDPPVGALTEHLFDGLFDLLQDEAPEPMSVVWGCDLNFDNQCDQIDQQLLQAASGCQGQPGFVGSADIDKDGCITDVDEEAWSASYARYTSACGPNGFDTDSDGTPDCQDDCPADAGKIAPGACGCGVTDNNEVCNGQDDDCDGTVDNGFNLGAACTVGVGVCQRTGVLECAATGGTQCSATPGAPGIEICGDGIDQDCDGHDLACPPPGTAQCGNGTVETGEQCDDGNTVSGDGCSAECRTEGLGFRFSGFFPPIDNNGVLNQAKAGQTIPVKWRVTNTTGVPISDPAHFISVTSVATSCTSVNGAGPEVIEMSAGKSGLQYLGGGNWQFNWKTPKSYAGQCRIMRLNLADQSDMTSTRTATFRFK